MRLYLSSFRALLVGDTAAMVVYGHDSTVPITMGQLIPLVQAVVRGTRTALIVADLPLGAYQGSAERALDSAARHLNTCSAGPGGSRAAALPGTGCWRTRWRCRTLARSRWSWKPSRPAPERGYLRR